MRFEEILVLSVVITGLICLLDFFFLRKRRIKNNKNYIRTSEEIKDPLIIEYSKSFFPVLLLVLVLRSFIAEPFRIPTASMKPTLLEGDFIVVNKFNYGLKLPVSGFKLLSLGDPKRGDVIVFRHTKEMDLIKRIVGLPGDHILYKNKTLYINGKAAPQEYQGKDLDTDITSGHSWPVMHKVEELEGARSKTHDIFLQFSELDIKYRNNDIIVPEGQYFVMGDNRDNSIDSRYWGFVKDKDIIGRAFGTWMSWDPINKDVRWTRLGKKIR